MRWFDEMEEGGACGMACMCHMTVGHGRDVS